MLLLFSSHSMRAAENVVGSRTKKRKYFSTPPVTRWCSSLPQEAPEARNGASSQPDLEVSVGEDTKQSHQQQQTCQGRAAPPQALLMASRISPWHRQPVPSRPATVPEGGQGSETVPEGGSDMQSGSQHQSCSVSSRMDLPPGSTLSPSHPHL